MINLRLLVVGKGSRLAERLKEAGHQVTPASECAFAMEMLEVQRFDAVVLAPDLSVADQDRVAKRVKESNRDGATPTAVLGVTRENGAAPGPERLDGYLPDDTAPENLSRALMNLAVRSPLAGYCDPRHQQGLPVLEVSELKEQLDYDNELLLELVGLFHSERQRQTAEMREALATADIARLARIAHTIKGSLGSLQAPAARAEAEALERAALSGDAVSCERLLPRFESKLDELDVQLQLLSESLTGGH